MQNDVTYLALMLGLFALMFALVYVCDRIIGTDEAAVEEQGGSEPDQTDEAVGDQVAA